MRSKDKLPEEIYKIIDKTVIALEKKCEPCQVIINRVITDKKMMPEEKLSIHTTAALKKLAKYIYHRGIVDGINTNEREKDKILREAMETVIHFEARIIAPDYPVE